MRTLVPGEWYILFKCTECETRQILFPDLSEGRAQLRATYKVQCVKCDYTGKYDSEILERYQHPPTADPQPIHGLAFFALFALLRSFGWARIKQGCSLTR